MVSEREVRIYKVRIGQVMTVQVGKGRLKDQVKTGQGQVGTGQFKSGQINFFGTNFFRT